MNIYNNTISHTPPIHTRRCINLTTFTLLYCTRPTTHVHYSTHIRTVYQLIKITACAHLQPPVNA